MLLNEQEYKDVFPLMRTDNYPYQTTKKIQIVNRVYNNVLKDQTEFQCTCMNLYPSKQSKKDRKSFYVIRLFEILDYLIRFFEIAHPSIPF